MKRKQLNEVEVHTRTKQKQKYQDSVILASSFIILFILGLVGSIGTAYGYYQTWINGLFSGILATIFLLTIIITVFANIETTEKKHFVYVDEKGRVVKENESN